MAGLIRPVQSAATMALMPLLGLQGLWVRMRTPVLPEAAPPFAGIALAPFPPASGVKPLGLLVLGESTAAGVGATSHHEALTGRTAVALAQRCDRSVLWHALGANGATAARLRQNHAAILAPFTKAQTIVIDEQQVDELMVLIALGVNDSIRMTPPALWRQELAALIDELRAVLGPCRVVLAGVPPMARFPALPVPLRTVLGAHSRRLDRELRILAGRTPDVYHCPTPLPDPAHFARDRFHPGVAGYAAWGDVLAEAIAAHICTPTP